MHDFKKLAVWQKSHQLNMAIYQITETFPEDEQFGLVNLMRKASVSIPAKIAEGCGRSARGAMARCLDSALGSGSELEYYLLMSYDLGYLDQAAHDAIDPLLQEVKGMLSALIHKIRSET